MLAMARAVLFYQLEDKEDFVNRVARIVSSFPVSVGEGIVGAPNRVREVLRNAGKVSCIVTPVCAEETGLVPADFSVYRDSPEKRVDFAKLYYGWSPVLSREGSVTGDIMLKRVKEAKGIIGSLGFAAILVEAQKGGFRIFPAQSREPRDQKQEFVMPLTLLLDKEKHLVLFVFVQDDSGLWVPRPRWVDSHFRSYHRCVRSL